MGRRRATRAGAAILLACAPPLGAASCGGEPEPATVTIVQPKDHAALPGPNVRVELAAGGVRVAPASAGRPGTAHHHLFVDRGLPRLDEPISGNANGVVDLDGGETDYILMGLSRGSHRVIALLADGDHLPLDPPAADTVRFTIVGRR